MKRWPSAAARVLRCMLIGRIQRSLAVVLSIAITGTTLVVASAPASAAAPSIWNPEATALLTTQAGSGTAVPVVQDDVLDGSLGLATSLEPKLQWKDLPKEVTSQVRFQITTLAKVPKVLWEGGASPQAGSATIQVRAGVLAQGGSYQWQAFSSQDKKVATPLHTFSVDTQRPGLQATYGVGPVSVAEVSGEPIVSFTSNSVSTRSGAAAFSMNYRPTNAPEGDLPAGWRLQPGSATSTWIELKVNADGTVTLTSQTGQSLTFKPTDSAKDSYEPVFGNDQTWPGGIVTTLVPTTLSNGDVTWAATDQSRTVTTFSATNKSETKANPTSVYSDGSLLLQQRWRNNALQAVVDPTTGSDVFDFYYAGSPECPSHAGISGAIDTPTGMLCGAADWSGVRYGVYYVSTPAGPAIGRIVAGSGAYESAQVSDYQWDSSRRLVGVRSPGASADVASGAINGLGEQDPRALYQLAYDGEGRVASITPPAGLLPGSAEGSGQTARVASTFTYSPNFAVATGGQSNVQSSSNPSTMLLNWQSTGTLPRTTYTWDVASGNPLETKDQSTGAMTKIVYNKGGLPIEQFGPTTGAITGSNSPKLYTGYDEDANGTPWTGVAAFYWPNAGFQGAPQTSSIGPVLSDGTPTQLAFRFSSAPPGVTPGPDGWSARLMGNYAATAEGTYTFAYRGDGKAWVQGIPCAPTCKLQLPANQVIQIRIDVSASGSTPTPAVDLLVTNPSGSTVAVPKSSLTPGLGLATREWTFDSFSATSPTEISAQQKALTITTMNPATGQILQTQLPSGTVVTNTYNADGTLASTTTPAGEVISNTYSSPQASTAISCAGQGAVAQHGLLSSVARPGMPAVTYLYNAAGQSSATGQGSTKSCGSNVGSSLQSAGATSGTGSATGTFASIVRNDPMVGVLASATGSSTRSTTVTADLLGRTIVSKDEWGTTTTFSYGPSTGLLDTVTETTATGQRRVETYTYNANGNETGFAVDGKTIETLAYGGNGNRPTSATLSNGVQMTYVYGPNLQLAQISYRFANGEEAKATGTYSAGGRLLCSATSAPDGTATQCFQSNLSGMITGSSETGTVPVLATAWQAGFQGAKGANGDRTSLTATLSEAAKKQEGATQGPVVTNATFGAGDVLTSLNVNDAPQALQIDASGRIVEQGSATLTYDASGDLLGVANKGGTLSLGYGPSGVDQEALSIPKLAKPTKESTAPSSTTTTSTTESPSTVPLTTSTSTPSADSTTITQGTTTTTSPTTTTTGATTTTTEAPPVPKPTAPPELTKISFRFSGNDLLLNDKNEIVGQDISLTAGPMVGLSAAGAPTTWAYQDINGSVAWRSGESGGPSATETYNAWGQPNSLGATHEPTTALGAVMSQFGWGAGSGGQTVLVDQNLVQMGARTYDAVTGRFLQPDPEVLSSNLYGFANGDPVDNTDPSGNAWSAGSIFGLVAGIALFVVFSAAALAVTTTAGTIGLIVGSLAAGAAVDAASQALDTGTVNWKQIGIGVALNVAIMGVMYGAGWAIGKIGSKILDRRILRLQRAQDRWFTTGEGSGGSGLLELQWMRAGGHPTTSWGRLKQNWPKTVYWSSSLLKTIGSQIMLAFTESEIGGAQGQSTSNQKGGSGGQVSTTPSSGTEGSAQIAGLSLSSAEGSRAASTAENSSATLTATIGHEAKSTFLDRVVDNFARTGVLTPAG